MNHFEQLKQEWNRKLTNEPTLQDSLENKIEPLLLHNEAEFIQQGMELLCQLDQLAHFYVLESSGLDLELKKALSGASLMF